MIEIRISVEDNHAKSAREQFDEALAALGLMRRPLFHGEFRAQPIDPRPLPRDEEQSGAKHETLTVGGAVEPNDALIQAMAQAGAAQTRIPGKPSPGRRQRTREEIAEDDKYFAAVKNNDPSALERTLPAQAPAVDPQDAADEAAERAAKKTGLDHDDLRQAIGRYFKKFAAPESIKNIPIILGRGIQEVPPDQIQAAIDKIEAIIASGDPLGVSVSPVKSDGTVVTNVRAAQIPLEKSESGGLFGDDPRPEPPATRESVIDAIRGYARKYDGDVKTAADAKIAGEDIPRILYEACGKYKVGEIAPENYGAARAAVVAATQNNPFQRTAA